MSANEPTKIILIYNISNTHKYIDFSRVYKHLLKNAILHTVNSNAASMFS